MSLTLQKDVARRLQRASGHRGPVASALFGHSVRLLDAAEELELTTTEPTDEESLEAALGCIAPAVESLATATLQLSLVARDLVADAGADGTPGRTTSSREAPVDHVTRLLFAASQNLRIAAEASAQARGSLVT